MNKYFRKVQEMLKTNKDIKALGFSRKEIKGIAAKVANKLKLDDDATDDDVSDAISEAIDDVLPYLQLTQSIVDRQVQSRLQHRDDDDLDDEPDDEPDDNDEPARKSPSKKNRKSKKDGDEDSATLSAIKDLTKLVATLQGDVTALKSGKTTDSRRAKVEKLLANTGRYGERTLKSFSRMTFNTEEEFEDYLDDLKDDIEEINQERANKGLETLGKIPAPNKKYQKEEDQLMSDDEVKKLAAM